MCGGGGECIALCAGNHVATVHSQPFATTPPLSLLVERTVTPDDRCVSWPPRRGITASSPRRRCQSPATQRRLGKTHVVHAISCLPWPRDRLEIHCEAKRGDSCLLILPGSCYCTLPALSLGLACVCRRQTGLTALDLAMKEGKQDCVMALQAADSASQVRASAGWRAFAAVTALLLSPCRPSLFLAEAPRSRSPCSRPASPHTPGRASLPCDPRPTALVLRRGCGLAGCKRDGRTRSGLCSRPHHRERAVRAVRGRPRGAPHLPVAVAGTSRCAVSRPASGWRQLGTAVWIVVRAGVALVAWRKPAATITLVLPTRGDGCEQCKPRPPAPFINA